MNETCQELANKWNMPVYLVKHKNTHYAMTTQELSVSRKKCLIVVNVFNPINL